MEYNILEMTIRNYMMYHWEHTDEARRKLRMNDIEWKMVWEKKYYQEKCKALEKELTKVKARLREVLKEKLNE